MGKKKILFINQEISPYVPDTHMSVLGRTIPQAIQERNHEIRTFMPKWGNINERRGMLHEVIRLSGMNLIINDTDHPLIIKVATIPATRVQVYFIYNDDYYAGRQMTVNEQGEAYADNGERAIFFARSVLETVKKQHWVPDIIHCQGWMSAAVPFYVKTAYREEPSFADTKVVTSLFAKSLDGTLEENFRDYMEFRDAKAELLQKYKSPFDFAELSKLAIDYSDGIVEAEKGVGKELMTYAKNKNIPILKYQEELGQACDAFYDQICPDAE